MFITNSKWRPVLVIIARSLAFTWLGGMSTAHSDILFLSNFSTVLVARCDFSLEKSDILCF